MSASSKPLTSRWKLTSRTTVRTAFISADPKSQSGKNRRSGRSPFFKSSSTSKELQMRESSVAALVLLIFAAAATGQADKPQPAKYDYGSMDWVDPDHTEPPGTSF